MGSPDTAQRLHIMPSMKSIVGIVALAVFGGCGVGVDDPEGAHAVGLPVQVQALTATASGGGDALAPNLAATADGTTGAPQDPIPARTPPTVLDSPLPSPLTGGGVPGR